MKKEAVRQDACGFLTVMYYANFFASRCQKKLVSLQDRFLLISVRADRLIKCFTLVYEGVSRCVSLWRTFVELDLFSFMLVTCPGQDGANRLHGLLMLWR